MDYVTKATDTITSFPSDVLIIGGALIVLLIAIFYKARKPAIRGILSFYPAFALYSLLPFGAEEITNTGTLAQELVTFGILLAVAYIVLRRYITRHNTRPEGFKGIFQTLIIAVSVLILALVLVTTIVPIDPVYTFTERVATLFGRDYTVWWLLAPLVGLFITSK